MSEITFEGFITQERPFDSPSRAHCVIAAVAFEAIRSKGNKYFHVRVGTGSLVTLCFCEDDLRQIADFYTALADELQGRS